MRIYLTYLFFLLSAFGFSQEPTDLQSLAQLISTKLPDTLHLNRHERVHFSFSADTTVPLFNYERVLNQYVQPLLSSYNRFFTKEKCYQLYVFTDPITLRKIVNFQEFTCGRQLFGPVVVYASVARGFYDFRDSLLQDWAAIIRDPNLFENVKQVDILIHKSGEVEFTGDDLLSQSLYAGLKPKWKQAIYYGQPANSVTTVKVRPDRSLDKESIQYTEVAYFIKDRFEGQVLKFDPDWSGVLDSKRSIAVSFIYDASIGQLSDVAVHSNEGAKAKRLIDWIYANYSQIEKDFLNSDSGSSRYLFYID